MKSITDTFKKILATFSFSLLYRSMLDRQNGHLTEVIDNARDDQNYDC